MQQRQMPGASAVTQTETLMPGTPVTSRPVSPALQSAPPQRLPFETGQGQSTGMIYRQGEATYRGMEILREQVVEHTITIPRKTVREETIERVVVVPEKRLVEEIVEEEQRVREVIKQVARPVYKEKIVEDIQYQTVENLIHDHQEKVEYRQRVQEVPVPKEITKFVPVVEERIRYVEKDQPILVDKIVVRQVEQVQEVLQEKIVERPIDQYVTVEIPVIKEIENIQEVARTVPVAVEEIVHRYFEIPTLQAEYTEVPYPVFTAVFTQIPIASHTLSEQDKIQINAMNAQLQQVLSQPMPSMCAIENLGNDLRNFVPRYEADPNKVQQNVQNLIQQQQGAAH